MLYDKCDRVRYSALSVAVMGSCTADEEPFCSAMEDLHPLLHNGW